MTRIMTTLAAGLLAGSAFANTSQFDGDYALGPLELGCVVGEGDVANAAFRIRDGQFFGIESFCRLANPTNIRDMPRAKLFDMQCSGEGMEWTDRVMLMKLDDGSLLRVFNGMAFADPPCPG